MRKTIIKWLGGVTRQELEEIRKSAFLRELEELEGIEDEEDSQAMFQVLARAYRSKGWVFASIWRVATTAASVPVDIYQDGKKVGEDHPARQLLEKPNTYETGWLLRMKTFADLLIEGRAFWVMEPLPKVSFAKAEVLPVENLRRLPPKQVEVVGTETEFVKTFRYSVNGKTTDIPPKRVVWFSTYDPLDERGGVGALEAAKAALLLDEYAYESNKRFFQNDGTPGNVLEPSENCPILSGGELRRYEEHWKRSFAGVKNRSRTAVLPPGYRHKAVNPPIKDMLFAEMRKWNRMEMTAPFGVPPTLLGDFEKANYSNMSAALRYFYLFTIDPILKLFMSAINSFFLPFFGGNFVASFDLAPFLPEDEKTQAEADAILVKAGILTRNEARAKRKLPPLSDGDMVEVGMHDVGVSVQPQALREMHEISDLSPAGRPIRPA